MQSDSPPQYIPRRAYAMMRPALLYRLAWFLWLLLLPGVVAAAPSLDNRYNDAKASYQKLLTTKEGKSRQHWLDNAKTFRTLYQKNPTHEVAPKSLFMLGTIYASLHERSNKAGDLSEAIGYFEDVATLYPRHTLADDALFLAGNLYLTAKNDQQKAARIFAKIVVLYPSGDMTTGAAEQLHKLKGLDYVHSLSATASAQPPPSQSPQPPANGESCQKAEVLSIRHWSNKSYTRVVIETATPVTFRKQVLEKSGDRPRRLYLDLVNCRINANAQHTLPIDDGLLKQVRNAQFTPDTVRVVFDTQADVSDYKVFSLDDPFRIIVDVRSNEASVASAKKDAKDTKEAKEKGKEAKSGSAPTLAQQLGLGVKRVVIDPGHGGKDPGTISPNGLKEKDITLAVGKKLAQELRDKMHCEVILTRDRDVFIPLEERTAIANSKEGDLFVSIHVNAAPNQAAKGIETYVLDLATNKEAMRVAAQENASSSKNISDLQAILLDLMQNSKLNESVKLAELVQNTMVEGVKRDFGHVNNLGVKKAPFIVLVGAQMPAILTEIAFSSNPQEEERLRDDRYLTLMAQQIAGGVVEYANGLNLASSRYAGDK